MVLTTYIFLLVITCSVAHNEEGSFNSVLSAIGTLSLSVNRLSIKVDELDEKINQKFQRMENTFNRERESFTNMNRQLQVVVNEKTAQLDTKIDSETSIIMKALSTTNRDVQHLSTQIEDIGQFHRTISEEGNNKRKVPIPPTGDFGSPVVQSITNTIESSLSLLLGRELTHLNYQLDNKLEAGIQKIISSFEYRFVGVHQICQATKKQMKGTRQEVEHIEHLQQNLARNITAVLQEFTIDNGFKKHREEMFRKEFKKALDAVIPEAMKSYSNFFKVNGTTKLGTTIKKGGAESALPYKQSVQPRTDETYQKGSTHFYDCQSQTEQLVLGEMKQLLHKLVVEGEETRRGLNNQTTEGLELLKQLHHRFSVLMKRMNKTPDNGKTLLAEVKELESLVETSYQSILHAQNVFISSCHQLQGSAPTMESKLGDILNKLVSNIRLGHKFNNMQMEELKTMIEDLGQNFTHNGRLNLFESFHRATELYSIPSDKADPLLKELENFHKMIVNIGMKFSDADNKLTKVGSDIAGVEIKSHKAKEKLDELQTTIKDIKGYTAQHSSSIENIKDYLKKLDKEYRNFKNSMVHPPIKTFRLISSKNNISKYIKMPELCAKSLINQTQDWLEEGLPILKIQNSNDSEIQSDIHTGSTVTEFNGTLVNTLVRKLNADLQTNTNLTNKEQPTSAGTSTCSGVHCYSNNTDFGKDSDETSQDYSYYWEYEEGIEDSRSDIGVLL